MTDLEAPPKTTGPNRARDSGREAPPRTRIRPPGRWEGVNVGELWQYRELLYFLAWRDVKVRYKQAVLGIAWAVLQPALMMAVFTVFFGRVAGVSTAGVPGPLFYLTGLLPWFFFATAVTGAAGSVVASERLIAKAYFPRLVIPLAAVLTAIVDFAVACSLLAAVALWYEVTPTWNLLLLPVVAALIGLLAAGVGSWVAALTVEYRDFRYVVPFAVQLGLFATPTIYTQPTGSESGWLWWLSAANPMTALVQAFRVSVLGGNVPWTGVGVAAAVAVGLMVLGCLYFRKVEARMADVI